ncbi:MAG: HAMP domain-containing histidine kinase [Chloroflexi bacterium]|nr:HAMP domain-containing histidine kinase [Chloroflexota bacterium]
MAAMSSAQPSVLTRAMWEERQAGDRDGPTAGYRAGNHVGALEPHELRHELGNLLAPALGYSQLLLRRLPADSQGDERQALELIMQSIRRTMHLLEQAATSDALGFSPRSAGPAASPASLPRGPCNLRDVLVQALAHVPPERAADVRLRLRAEQPLLGAWEGEQVIQVVVNLLSNAAKYSDPGMPINVELGSTGGWAQVVVRDHGIGIPADALERIFHGYRTASAQRKAPGQGIGLQVCRRLVEAAGGRLWATSSASGGTAFVLQLPLAPTSPPEATSASSR